MPAWLDFCDPRATAASAHQPDQRLRCRFAVPLQTLVAHTPDQVAGVLDAVQTASAQGHWCLGYLRYEAASAFDAALQTHPADGPLAWFEVFAQALPWPDQEPALRPQPDEAVTVCAETLAGLGSNDKRSHGPAQPKNQLKHHVTEPAAPHASAATSVRWHNPLARASFDAHLETIHQAIAAGEFYQVNYTSALAGDFSGSPAELFARLQRAQPGGYAACIDTGAEHILSVSPELFFDWDGGAAGGHILTRPMKGTAPRGGSAEQDAALVQTLVTSPKERSENVMIVDLLRNDLSRIALPHSVKVPALFAVHSLPTVHQMVSDVTAQTRPGTTLAQVFAALFPCGSITGAPKVRAMQTICDLEPQARGVYCGAIGVVRPGGHATFNVAIRTVTLQGTHARCGIGSGITFDATAALEWQEWQHKRGFLERASLDFQLLETLRLQHNEFHNLGAHLARLAGAARHFGYKYDEDRIRTALQTLICIPAPGAASVTAPQGSDVLARQHPRSHPHAHQAGLPATASDPVASDCAWRVRLLLDAHGTPVVEKYELNRAPALIEIGLAATSFEAFSSEFTRFKTTRRAHYEAYAPTDAALFDTLLYNPRGELTECTRGNIALLLDGQWLTPALHCGLLPGVGRAQFLAEGRLTEAVITLADLPRVQALAFVNSLRGWLPARLQALNQELAHPPTVAQS